MNHAKESFGITQYVDTAFDVYARLQKMRIWQAEFDETNKFLQAIIDNSNPNSHLDLLRGIQASIRQDRLRVRLVAEPIELHQVSSADEYIALEQHLRRQYATLSPASQREWMVNFLFILTPQLRELYNKVERVRIYRSLGQRRNFLLGGPSGMGKSTALSWFSLNHQPHVDADRNIIPLIMADAKVTNKSPRDLLQYLILEFGHAFKSRDSETKLLMQLTLFIRQCRTEVMVIDEIEHLRTHHMRRHILEISNHNPSIPIICASCHPEKFTYDDPEIAGRWNDYFPLRPYLGDDLRSLLIFMDLLLPLVRSSDLADPEIAGFIEDATGGILRDIAILISDSAYRAIVRRLAALSLDLLRDSWAVIRTQERPDFLQLHNRNRS